MHKLNLVSAYQHLFTNRFVYLLGKQIEEKRWEYTYQQYRRKYTISPTFGFSGSNIVLEGDGKIILNGSSYIRENSRIISPLNSIVTIGTNCAIAGFVTISGSSRVADQDFSKTCIWKKETLRTKDEPVQIGDDCWIGTGVFINPGVSIGNNAVVGANSVVSKNLPPHSISAGVPAKVIRFKSYLDKQEMWELAKNYWASLSSELKEQLKQRYKICEIIT